MRCETPFFIQQPSQHNTIPRYYYPLGGVSTHKARFSCRICLGVREDSHHKPLGQFIQRLFILSTPFLIVKSEFSANHYKILWHKVSWAFSFGYGWTWLAERLTKWILQWLYRFRQAATRHVSLSKNIKLRVRFKLTTRGCCRWRDEWPKEACKCTEPNKKRAKIMCANVM